jgi:hypothetical protein
MSVPPKWRKGDVVMDVSVFTDTDGDTYIELKAQVDALITMINPTTNEPCTGPVGPDCVYDQANSIFFGVISGTNGGVGPNGLPIADNYLTVSTKLSLWSTPTTIEPPMQVRPSAVFASAPPFQNELLQSLFPPLHTLLSAVFAAAATA